MKKNHYNHCATLLIINKIISNKVSKIRKSV